MDYDFQKFAFNTIGGFIYNFFLLLNYIYSRFNILQFEIPVGNIAR